MSKDIFVDFMEKQRIVNEKVFGGTKDYSTILRAFRKVYSKTSFDHLIQLSKIGISTYEGDVYNMRILIGYMYSKHLFSKPGMPFGKALNVIGKDEKYLSKIVHLNFDNLLKELKNVSSLMASKSIKLNPYEIFILLNGWKTQSTHKNKNWIKKKLTKNYF